ncbi:MAG: transcription elongation factor GreB [Gammaproteobacteria bacterium]|nr:transcription elongation factor GreB [Gammaproteobacteria bacterium]
MGRYRPPQQPGSKYITPAGYQHLASELDHLWFSLRPEVTKAVSAAAAEGDRSENAEYIYRKKQLREIDSRVRHLRKRLENMKVVSSMPDDHNKVFFGAWVTVEDENGDENRYRIVGPDEFSMQKDYISMDSPVAKALMGKNLDDEIKLVLPGGNKRLVIVDIEYKAES